MIEPITGYKVLYNEFSLDKWWLEVCNNGERVRITTDDGEVIDIGLKYVKDVIKALQLVSEAKG